MLHFVGKDYCMSYFTLSYFSYSLLFLGLLFLLNFPYLKGGGHGMLLIFLSWSRRAPRFLGLRCQANWVGYVQPPFLRGPELHPTMLGVAVSAWQQDALTWDGWGPCRTKDWTQALTHSRQTYSTISLPLDYVLESGSSPPFCCYL